MIKKDLLFITARTPWPLVTGDRIRCYNLLLKLSKEYKVTLVVLEETNEDNNLLDIVDELISLKKKNSALKILSALISVAKLNTLQEGIYHRRDLRRRLGEKHYDVAVFHLLRSLANERYVHATTRVMDMCDPVSLTYRQIYQKKNLLSPWFYISTLEMILARRRERKTLSKFKRIFLHNPNDLKDAGLDSECVKISTMGISSSNHKPYFDRSDIKNKILFIGNIDYVPNSTGLDWFLSKVFPKLPDDYVVTIVGAGGEALKEKYIDERIKFTGLVDDLVPYLASHGVGIAPMFIASGIQNKVLEYIYSGLAVVCSPKVKSGLLSNYSEAVHSHQTDPSEWAEAIINLNYNKESAELYSKRVKLAHSWDTITQNFIKEIED